MDKLVTAQKALPPAEGVDEVMVPGEPENRTYRDRAANGIPLPPGTVANLRSIASRFEAPLPSGLSSIGPRIVRGTVLDQLTEAFGEPDEVESGRYWRFTLGDRQGASIYVQWSNRDQARIAVTKLDNNRFPNSVELKRFLDANGVPLYEIRKGRWQYRVGREHIRCVIDILRG